jgi:hypothetical protein
MSPDDVGSVFFIGHYVLACFSDAQYLAAFQSIHSRDELVEATTSRYGFQFEETRFVAAL